MRINEALNAISIALAVVCLAASAQAQTAAAYSGDFTSGTSAAPRTSTNYTLTGDTLGQFVVGESNAPDNTYVNNEIENGAWYSDGPSISVNPVSQTICSQDTATFSVTATGSDTLNYQWQISTDGGNTFTDIPGADASIYTTNVAGIYECVVSDSYGIAVSAQAVLTVNSAPVITTQPVDQTVNWGSSATFTVAASGDGDTYQWYWHRWHDDIHLIPGADSASYTTSTAGGYDCVVTNSCGTTTSNVAQLNVLGVLPGSVVSQAKQSPDGTPVTLSSGPVVTRSFTGFFYLEDVNRDAGIRVDTANGSTLAEGSTATVTGTIETVNGERAIEGATVSNVASGTVPGTLGMIGTAAVRPLAQGLLARMCGVANVAPGATDTFTLWDGSDSAIDVKLYGVALPADGAFISVQGVIGADTNGTLLRVNNSSDIW